MAAELKTQFIEAIRLTPDGINDFLETPIPEAPTISTPADVDSAIVANGVCAKYILDLLAPFAGLTPIELLLRIGQHNNVLESAMLAGLEYLEGDAGGDGGGGAEDFSILEPEDGGSYLPGSLRLVAEATNGSILQIAVEAGSAAPVALASDDGQTFYGFVRLEEVGSYTATFTALFEDESTQTAAVSFAMATEAAPGGSEPQQPDGSDLNAFEAAWRILKDVIDRAIKAADDVTIGEMAGAVISAAQQVIRLGSAALSKLGTVASAAAKAIGDKVDAAIAALQDWLGGRGLSRSRALTLDDLFMAKLAAMNAAGQAYHAAVIAIYWQNNQHPRGGYTSCPESLAGAAQAMNDKYGPGTVSF